MTTKKNLYFLAGLLGITSLLHGSAPFPRGLKNLQNTCYLNSGLQALLPLKDLTGRAQSIASEYKHNSVALDYLDLCNGKREMDRRKVRPLCDFYIKERGMDLDDQGDSCEYLTWLLGKISNGTDKGLGNKTITDLYFIEGKETKSYQGISLDTMGRKLLHQATLDIALPFEGLINLASSVQESVVANHAKYQINDELQAEITGLSLGQKVMVKKQLHITKLPQYLFIQLNRIQTTKAPKNPAWRPNLPKSREYIPKRLPPVRIRSNAKVTFNLENLSVPQELNDDAQKIELFDLVAVIVHGGTVDNGHYKAYAKYGNTWYECNDNEIRKLIKKEDDTEEIDEMKEFANKGIDKDGFLPTLFVYEKKTAAAHREDNARTAEAADRKKREEAERMAREAAEAERKAQAELQEKLDAIRKAHEAEQARKAEEQKRSAAEKEAQHQTEEALVAAEDAERAEQQERVRQSLERAKEALSDARAARLKTEAARKAQEAEQARKAEEKRLAEQEEARRIEAQRVALEKAQKEREDAARIAREAEERKAEAERLAEQEAQEKKLAEEKRAAELVERKAQEEARRTEERRRAEEKMRATEEAVAKLKAQEEARKAEEQRMAESSRLAEQESQIRADGATAMELAVQEHLNQDIRIKVQREQMAADARVAARVHQEMNGGYKNPRDVQTRLAAINAAAATHKNNGGK